MKSEANKLLVSTVKKLIHRRGMAQLEKIIARAHPADLAYVFNFLTKQERVEFFAAFGDHAELAAGMLPEVEPPVLTDFLNELGERKILAMLELMSPDDAADVLELIDDEERKELILTMMHREEFVTTQSLLEFDPESAGGLMVPDFFALNEFTTARDAIQQLQEDAGRTEVVFYLYVINEHGHLVGVTSLRELVLAKPDTPINSFMITDIIRVQVDTDQEEVARLIARYNLVALPVVDGNNHLVGVVTVDDIIDVIRLEATEDMMLMAGAGDQQVENLRISPFGAARARAPWLFPSFVGGLCCLALLWSASDSIKATPIIAAVFPVVMMVSGNVGTQSAAIVTRGLALGRRDFVELGKVVLGELLVGALLGVFWGGLLGAGSYLALGFGEARSLYLALEIGGAMLASMTLAASLGALMPMLFSRLGLDPAIATGPLVTTIVDVVAVALCLMLLSAGG